MLINNLIYKTIRPIGGLRIARYFARKHPRIIMYHRLSNEGLNGALTPDQFRSQMLIVKKFFNPIRLEELIRLNAIGELPEHSVSITFDDGYEDFSAIAFPILSELNIPVTLFVTTGFINGDLWLWPDQLRFALTSTEIKSKLEIPGFDFKIDLLESTELSWSKVADHCLTISNQEKGNFIRGLYNELGIELPSEAPDLYRPLSWEKIRNLMERGVEIGSHSHSHPIMTKLTDAELKNEVELSRAIIVSQTGQDSLGFCYPNGQPCDFQVRETEAVKAARYKYAVAAFPGRTPLRNLWSINRYPASTSYEEAEKTIYGLKFFSVN